MGSETKGKLKDEVDELFKLPLAEFTAARNALAAQLKQRGLANDASLVKSLSKPPISAWTVNQLYWHHREEFDRLLAAGQHFRKAQTSGKIANMRGSLDTRREALSRLSDLATSLLQDGGHNPAPDTLRRVTTTLEAMSALASFSDGPTPGRLTQDVDPPGFESLASFIPGAATKKGTEEPKRAVTNLQATRQTRIAAAKLSLQAAKRSLADARATAQSLEATQKKAYAEAKQAEKQLREAEERFKKAKAVSEAAAQRSQSIAAEAADATKAAEDARRALEKASKELESMLATDFDE